MEPVQRIFFQTVRGVTTMFIEAGCEYTGLIRFDDRLHGVRLYPNGNSFLASATEEELRPFDGWEWAKLTKAKFKERSR